MELNKIYEELNKPKTAFILNNDNYKMIFEFLQSKIGNPDKWSVQQIEFAIYRNKLFSINHRNELTISTENFYTAYNYKILNVDDMLNKSESESEGEKEEMKDDIIKNTLEKTIIDTILPDVKKEIMKSCGEIVSNVTTVVIKLDEEVVKKSTEKAHYKFKDLLTFVNNNIPVMLTGGAGSGKSSTCEKVAKVLGLDFYFSNAVTQEYKLTGFIDANGKYQETQFYKAFKNGGLFVLDEIDASVPEALVILNTAIANGYFDFPNEKVTAHKDFRIVACANTYGLGGNDIYVGRNQLDGASLDRFAVIYFDYDTNLEKDLVENKEYVEFIQELRKRIKERKIKHIVSMRASLYGDKLLKAGLDIRQIFTEIVFKNMELDDIKSIGKLPSDRNKYIKEFNEFIKE